MKEEINKIIKTISQRKCIECGVNLDTDLKRTNWKFPLCQKHRLEYLKENAK